MLHLFQRGQCKSLNMSKIFQGLAKKKKKLFLGAELLVLVYSDHFEPLNIINDSPNLADSHMGLVKYLMRCTELTLKHPLQSTEIQPKFTLETFNHPLMPLTYIKQEADDSHFKIKHFQPPCFWPLGPLLTPSKAQKASNSTKLTRSHGSRLQLFKMKANNTFKMTL